MEPENPPTSFEDNLDYKEHIVNLTEQIKRLLEEKKNIHDEFNVQRAKMQKLFIQKEEELERNAQEKMLLNEEIKKMQTEIGEARSQLLVAGLRLESELEVEKRKAQEEVATLQQLFQETMEQSSTSKAMYDSELKKLQMLAHQLQTENQELRSLTVQSSPHHTSSESTPSLAPGVMLSAVTKTIVRKLGADGHSNQENLEESMRRAQEDAEVLRALLVPLEEEIHQLKDKLRATDEQLQQCRLCGHPDSKSTRSGETSPIKNNQPNEVNIAMQSSQNEDDSDSRSMGSPIYPEKKSPVPCDMCNNYEMQLVKEQQNVEEFTHKLATAEKSLERQKEDLLKEISFRQDMEEKWTEKREEHKEQVSELKKRTITAEQALAEVKQLFDKTKTVVSEQLTRLSKEREQVREHLIKVQKENDNLVGKHSVHSQQLQSENINFPNDVNELQLLMLKSHENLIAALVGKEAAIEQQESLRYEIQLMREQMLADQQSRQELENSLVGENESLKRDLQRVSRESTNIIELQKKLVEALAIKKQLESSNSELRSRVSSLQQELDNSEQVQKDFVRLSQSLQMELEKIRASDTQVRWQHEDDVTDCPSCNTSFAAARRKKIHCRHCGQIFCTACLNHTVLSGPNGRPCHVCGVCHTLLNRDTAPYFSTEAPHLPD